jgi:hypothetical protein
MVQSRRTPFGGRPSVRRLVVSAALVIVLAGCAQFSSGPSTTAPSHVSTTTTSPTTALSPSPERAFAEAFDSPQMTITTTAVYLSWWLSPPARGVSSELARVDLSTGQVLARRQLGAAYFDQAVAAAGSLWVTTSSKTSNELLRLNPTDLALIGQWRLPVVVGQVWRPPAPCPDDRRAAHLLGRALAPLQFPQPDQDAVLAIGPRQLFYAAPASSGRSYVEEEPIPAACRPQA